MFISAQISVYPLRQGHLSPVIDKALSVLLKRGLEVSPGSMSSVVVGEDDILFGALKDAFAQVAETGDVVMAVTFSNSCLIS